MSCCSWIPNGESSKDIMLRHTPRHTLLSLSPKLPKRGTAADRASVVKCSGRSRPFSLKKGRGIQLAGCYHFKISGKKLKGAQNLSHNPLTLIEWRLCTDRIHFHPTGRDSQLVRPIRLGWCWLCRPERVDRVSERKAHVSLDGMVGWQWCSSQ